MKYQPKTKPFPHQSRATLAALRARNFGLFMEPRTGKSKTALDASAVWSLKGVVRRTLIVAPKIALDVWEQQIEQHYPYRCHVEDFDREWVVRGERFTDDRDISFFLAGREKVFRRTNGDRNAASKEIESWDPDLIIVDESHEYKRPGARGTQDLWRMVTRLRKARGSSGLPHVLLLTGTPNPKGWMDLFAQFRIMDPSIFGTNAQDFKDRYVVFGKGKRKWTIIKYNRVKELEKKVRAHSITVSAEETGMANEQFFENLHVTMPPLAKKLYLELAEEMVAEFEGRTISAKNAGVKRLRLLQITSGYTTDGQQIHSAKSDALKSYVSLLLEQGESVVVYSRFSAEVEACFNVLESVGFRAFRVAGGTSDKDRRLATKSLAVIPKTPTAIAFQFQAGSRAIELVGAAETVYTTPPDGWVDYFQTVKRTQGPNQHRPVRYTHLVCRGTVDVNVIRGLQRKEDWHGELMKNPKRYLYGL